ncbi:hypothetical protein JCM6882_006367 [Rhodosporidiobolus microsporus]
MNFLSSLANAAINASSAALHSAQGGIPGVPGYLLGERVVGYEGKSIWSLWSGTKKDDQTPVTVFSFDLSSPSPHSSSSDRRALLPLARNALRKLRALRHPNILKFLDGSETDNSVWIVTESVRSLASELEGGKMSEEAKVYGLLHVCTALGFLNRDGQSVHGGLRTTSVWVTPGGEFKLGGMEVCSRLDEVDGTMWNYGGLLPDSRTHASPEVRRGGWTALKEYDPSTLDSYLLHLFLYTLFVGPLPSSFLSPSSPSDLPSLPQSRAPSFPSSIFASYRRLGSPNPAARLKTSAFLELGQHPSEGWWPSNRLVKLSAALEGFALATENERAGLIRTLKAISAGAANAKTDPLPAGFLKSKVLPSLVHSFEFGGGSGAAQLLPVILGLAGAGEGGEGEEREYQKDVVQPIVRMYATPDRAVRMALLENLEKYIEKVSTKDVCERVWPHLMTGFGDVVPVIREATVKSILLIAPKLNDRILNNDLLRHLSKTQTDVEPGIRTNTCILLSRLSRHLNTSTQRKVLIPAFARALRDPFVHARIAGLMALMATTEVFEKEDLAGKVIPAMSICLVDREKIVRDQAFKAIDMFVKKCEALTASMPETALPPADPAASPSTNPAQQQQQQNGGLAAQAAAQTQPAIATSATGAAGALAGWAFASVSKKLSSAELAAPIERRDSTPSVSGVATPTLNGANGGGGVPRSSTDSATTPSLPGGFEKGTEDWGGDLIDVENDDADWNEFESGQAPPRAVDPLAARLSATKPKPGGARRGGALKLGAASRSSALRVPMDMDASNSWDLDEEEEAAAAASSFSSPAKPKPSPIPRAAAPLARATPIAPAVKKPTAASASLLAAAAAPPPPPPQPQPAPVRQAPPPPAPPSIIEPAFSPPPATTPAAPSPSPVPPASQPPSPLPPTASPPLAPVPPSLPTVAAPPPVSPGISPAVVPLPVSPAPGSPASSAPGTPTLSASGGPATGGSMAGMSKEEKAAALAKAREERKRRMAEAKARR